MIMTKLRPKRSISASRRAILDLLKTGGPQDAQALAEQLGVTAMAARQHLYELDKSGLVTFTEEARAVGRPAKIWRLAPGAEAFFPDGHADLSVELLGAMRQTFGEAGLDRLVETRAIAQRKAYGARMAGADDLAARLDHLAQIRCEEGYMAEVIADGSDFLFIENHCPICAAATVCQGLCRAELDVFCDVLGDDVTMERTEHIPQGARRCAYRIRAGAARFAAGKERGSDFEST